MTDPRQVSFWLDSLPADHRFTMRQQLPGDLVQARLQFECLVELVDLPYRGDGAGMNRRCEKS